MACTWRSPDVLGGLYWGPLLSYLFGGACAMYFDYKVPLRPLITYQILDPVSFTFYCYEIQMLDQFLSLSGR